MNSQSVITCDQCGTENPVQAFRCQNRACGKVFDGSAGNSIPLSRCITRSGQSIHKAGPAHSTAPQFPAEWRGRVPAIPQKPEVLVAIVGYSDDAVVRQSPVPPSQAGKYLLRPDASTNEAAGLRLAGELWRSRMPRGRLNVILISDGEPTSGGGAFGDDKEAGLKEAESLKQQGARIATVGVRGATMDFAHLRSVASAPALAFEAQTGGIARVFVHATQSLTNHRWGQTGGEFVVFVIDESGSMEEENKKSEVEEAVAASLALLQRL